MRCSKLWPAAATVLACVSVASVSVADETKAPATTGVPANPSQGSQAAPSGTVKTTTTQTTAPAPLDANGTMTPTPATSVPPATPPESDVQPSTPSSTTTITQAEIAPPPIIPPPEDRTTTVYRDKRPNTPLLVTGAALFAATYVTTAAVTASGGRPNGVDDHLYIPIAGPWINLARTEHESRDDVLIVGSGILQGIGAGLAISSFFIPQKVEAARIDTRAKVRITPTTYAGGGGLGAVGTF